MDAHIFCTEHILYLIISLALSAAAIALIKLYCKSLKAQTIAVKLSGALLLCFLILNRTACYIYTEHYFFPTSICGNLSLVFSVLLLFGKPDNAGFHFIVYPAIVFCLCANVYPTYITQDSSFWYLPTISGLLHHSVSIYSAVLLLVLRWVNPGTKHMLAFPAGFGIFLIYGLFNITVLGYDDSMNIIEPIISLGSLVVTWFFVLTVGTAVVWIINLAVDAAQKKSGCAVCTFYKKVKQKVKSITGGTE